MLMFLFADSLGLYVEDDVLYLIFGQGLFPWTGEVLKVGKSSQAVQHLKLCKWQIGWKLNVTTHFHDLSKFLDEAIDE